MSDSIKINMDRIRSFAGEITEERFTHVESFISDNMAIFIPLLGYCGYARKEDHTHPCPMFLIHFDDLGLLELNGTKYRSKPDTVFFLASETPHHELPSQIPARYLTLLMPDEYLRRIASEYNLCWEGLPVSGTFRTPAGLLNCLKAFMEEVCRDLPGQEQILNGIALQTAHILIRMLFNIDDKPDIRVEFITENYVINQVIEHIYKNIGNKITVEELALVANLSPSYFNQIFRKETGETPYRFILLIRLNHSLRLIDEGKCNLTEIAYRCGFSSSSHFSVAFQKEFSLTPSEYQKKRIFRNK